MPRGTPAAISLKPYLTLEQIKSDILQTPTISLQLYTNCCFGGGEQKQLGVVSKVMRLNFVTGVPRGTPEAFSGIGGATRHP